MTDTVRFPLVLGAITLCSAAGLAITYTATRDKIRFQEELQKAKGIASVLGLALDEGTLADPAADRPWQARSYPGREEEPESPFVVYEAGDPKTGERLYAAEGAAQGYSSKVRLIVGVGPSIEGGPGTAIVRAIRIVNQLETPGLGDRCTEGAFQRQFQRLPEAMLELTKGAAYRDPDAAGGAEHHVAAITGATITSNAVVDAVRQALGRIRHHLAHRGGAD